MIREMASTDKSKKKFLKTYNTYRGIVRQVTKQKSLSEFLPRGIHVLRTGIEPYMNISKLPYLQAVLQAVWVCSL